MIVPFPSKAKTHRTLLPNFPSRHTHELMCAQDVVFEVTVRKMYLRSLDLFDLTTLLDGCYIRCLARIPFCCAILLVHFVSCQARHPPPQCIQLTASRQELSGLGSSGSASASRAPRQTCYRSRWEVLVMTMARFRWCCHRDPDVSS